MTWTTVVSLQPTITYLGLLVSLVCLCLQAGYGHALFLKNMKRHRRAAECVVELPTQQGTVLFPDPAEPSNDNCVYRVSLNNGRRDNLPGSERCGSVKNVTYVDFSFRDVGEGSVAMSFSVSSDATRTDKGIGSVKKVSR